MIWDHKYDEGTPFHAVPYRLMEPVTVKVRLVDGTEELRRYGFGEVVRVMEPAYVYPVGGRKLLQEIPLENGEKIIEYPRNMRYERVT